MRLGDSRMWRAWQNFVKNMRFCNRSIIRGSYSMYFAENY